MFYKKMRADKTVKNFSLRKINLKTLFLNIKNISKYQLAIGLSSLSVVFGIIREFIIVALLGLSAKNDLLQIYLSIFYSISLSNDAVKLGVLNMCTFANLRYVFLSLSMVAIPYSILIGIAFYYISGGLTLGLLSVAILGGFLNLIMIMLVTYKQRYGAFLSAQCINVSPNFVLIPGVVLIYFFSHENVVKNLVVLYAIVPLIQIILLLLINAKNNKLNIKEKISYQDGVGVFLKQGIATIGEQFFQVILRSYFFKFGAGYLSLLSVFMRIYAATKFIFIDTYIASKVQHWGELIKGQKNFFDKLLNQNRLNILVFLMALLFCVPLKVGLFYFSMQLSVVLFLSFYFDTILRVVYYRINSFKYDAKLILAMGFFDGLFVLFVFVLSRLSLVSAIMLIWLWYILRMFLKILYYRRYYHVQL